jgi:hypothetical protein
MALTLSSKTSMTLANMARINRTSNHFPAGVSASKMTSCILSRQWRRTSISFIVV